MTPVRTGRQAPTPHGQGHGVAVRHAAGDGAELTRPAAVAEHVVAGQGDLGQGGDRGLVAGGGADDLADIP